MNVAASNQPGDVATCSNRFDPITFLSPLNTSPPNTFHQRTMVESWFHLVCSGWRQGLGLCVRVCKYAVAALPLTYCTCLNETCRRHVSAAAGPLTLRALWLLGAAFDRRRLPCLLRICIHATALCGCVCGRPCIFLSPPPFSLPPSCPSFEAKHGTDAVALPAALAHFLSNALHAQRSEAGGEEEQRRRGGEMLWGAEEVRWRQGAHWN